VEDSKRKCAVLISGIASRYIRERIRPFKDTLMSIFGERAFACTDSSKGSQGSFNARLDIFNRFAEKARILFSVKGYI
jgi:hypothetical protein